MNELLGKTAITFGVVAIVGAIPLLKNDVEPNSIVYDVPGKVKMASV